MATTVVTSSSLVTCFPWLPSLLLSSSSLLHLRVVLKVTVLKAMIPMRYTLWNRHLWAHGDNRNNLPHIQQLHLGYSTSMFCSLCCTAQLYVWSKSGVWMTTGCKSYQIIKTKKARKNPGTQRFMCCNIAIIQWWFRKCFS